MRTPAPQDIAPDIKLFGSHAQLADAAAHEIATLVRQKPDARLGLATGRTPLPVFEKLVEFGKQGLDFSRVIFTGLDEFVGLERNDPRTCRAYLRRHFFDHVKVDRANIHLLDGSAKDLRRECKAFEDGIIARGGTIDLQSAGIGEDGHIAFCGPGSSFDDYIGIVTLSRQMQDQYASEFGGDWRKTPSVGLSMGLAAIRDYPDRILLLANGEHKRPAMEKFLIGDISPATPASVLRTRVNVSVFVDEAAFPFEPQMVGRPRSEWAAHLRR